MTLPDQLTVARAASVPLVVLLYAWDFPNNEYWATALFCVAMATDWFDGRIARSRGVTSPLGVLAYAGFFGRRSAEWMATRTGRCSVM